MCPLPWVCSQMECFKNNYSNYLGLLGHWYRKTRPRCYLNHAGGMSPKASLQCSSCLKRGTVVVVSLRISLALIWLSLGLRFHNMLIILLLIDSCVPFFRWSAHTHKKAQDHALTCYVFGEINSNLKCSKWLQWCVYVMACIRGVDASLFLITKRVVPCVWPCKWQGRL